MLPFLFFGFLAGGDAGAPAQPTCVAIATESRWVPYGYNHVVILKSTCTRPAICTVSTDVNPTPQTVDVPSKQTVEVSTFLGSPSQTFAARVSCQLR